MDRISNGETDKEQLPIMKTDFLYIATSGGTDTIAAPGAGFQLEVRAVTCVEGVDAAFVETAVANLEFSASGQRVLHGMILVTPGVIFNNTQALTDLRVLGNENEALTLTNYSYSAGTASVLVGVFYCIVPV